MDDVVERGRQTTSAVRCLGRCVSPVGGVLVVGRLLVDGGFVLGAQVAGPQSALHYGGSVDFASLVDQAEPGAQVNEGCGDVQVLAELGGCVVVGERVVVVVETLAQRVVDHVRRLARLNLGVVGTVAVVVGGTVHQPGAVQSYQVPNHERENERRPKALAPQHYGNHRGHQYREHYRHPPEVAVLEHNVRIRLQVGHVDQLALFLHIRVLLATEPAHVGEKEAALDVVRVGVGLGELVVHSVVARPGVDAVLACHSLQDHQQHLHRPLGLVRPVRPQPVAAAGHAEAAGVDTQDGVGQREEGPLG